VLLRFWGTRGSIASPGPGTVKFGGNTSCVEVVTNSGARLILDCGTGARALGTHLMRHGPKPLEAHIVLSHTHWDHIQGFPFFAPVFVPGNRFVLSGPQGCHRSLPEVLSGQMEYTYFPVELGQLGAEIVYQDLSEGVHELGGVRITAQFLNHPAVTLGYKIQADGVSLLYLCDHEPFWEKLWRSDAEPGKLDSILHGGDRHHAAFMENADVVIHDAQYTPEEYPAKRNWGHSTYSYVTEIAAAAKVQRLFLTHHDPTHDDDFLRGVEDQACLIADSLRSPMVVSCAYEGCEESFENSSVNLEHLEETHHEDPFCGCSLQILIVDDDEDIRVLARKALIQAGHRVLEAGGGDEGLRLIAHHKPDLVILDLVMPPPDGIQILKTLRSRAETASLPVLVLTAKGDEETTRTSFELGASDFLNKPFTPPQLDARVRSCFARVARSQ
jgi:CheY-like chemotaxis protein